MEITCRKIYIFLFFFFLTQFASPQEKIIDINIKNFWDTRPAEVIINNLNYNFITVSKYLPVFQFNAGDNWYSSGYDLNIDGIKFNVFPFNFNSVELLPVDQIDINKIFFHEGFGRYNSGIFKGINFIRKNIPETTLVSLRGYFGSETGDPLIHSFTGRRVEQGNINKTPLSGAAGISGNLSDFSYKINAGYYGHFSTGSGNTRILGNRSVYFTNKQNKQIWGSADAVYNFGNERKFSIYGSFISYYGWDAPPLISNYIHFESYLYRLQASIENLPDDFNFKITRDESITESHEIKGVLPFKFSLSEYSLTGSRNFQISDKGFLIINGDYKIHSADNLEINRINSQKFFTEKNKEFSYGFSINSSYKPAPFLPVDLVIDYHNYNNRLDAFSYEAGMKYIFSKNININLKHSSTERFPNLTELYGNFATINIDFLSDTFFIKGNKSLKETIKNYTGLILNNNFDNLKFSAEVFLLNLKDPIEQMNLRSVLVESSGEQLNEAIYINGSNKKSAGFNFTSDIKLIKELSFSLNYLFTENKETEYFPKHKILISADKEFSFGGELILSYNYKSSTTWNNFMLLRNEAYKVPEGHTFDLIYNQKIGSFYFIEDLNLSARFLNIFNHKKWYFPIGNRQDRTLLFSMSANL